MDHPSDLMPPTSVSKTLNPEPSDPVNRKAKGLPQKSYQNAAKEGLEKGIVNHENDKPANGYANDVQKKTVVQEEHPGVTINGVKGSIANLNSESVLEKEKDGLTSLREPDGYDVSLQQDEKEKPSPDQDRLHKDELTSGRQAGQRWHTSA